MRGYHVAVRKNSALKRFRLACVAQLEAAADNKNSSSSSRRMFEGRALKANEFMNERLGASSAAVCRAARAAWGPPPLSAVAAARIRAYDSTTDESSSLRGGSSCEGRESVLVPEERAVGV